MSTRIDIHEKLQPHQLSRRSFIQLTGSALVASLFVACDSEAPAAEGEGTEKTFACETCETRIRAEENPNTFSARLWKFHTKFCPGWKEYQEHLASQL